jgi:putative nucleotidyltransferase with HDIG domain
MSPLQTASEDLRVLRWMERMRVYDSELYGHSVLVGELTAAFTSWLGYNRADSILFTQAALLHDIGKLKIGLDLLQRPGPLTRDERDTIRSHARMGHEILSAEGGWEPEVLTVVGDHHERLDGTGYPRGLFAEDIPESVRIVMLCDVYAAMTEVRCYGQTLLWQRALETMADKRTRIDMRLMQSFAAMIVASKGHAPRR